MELGDQCTFTTLVSSGTGVVIDIQNGTIKAGGIQLENNRWFTMDRTIPTTVGNYVNLGTYAVTNGGSNMNVELTIASFGYAQGKAYAFPTKYNGTAGTWMKVEAYISSGVYNDGGADQDTDLEINISGGNVALRLRRKLGTVSAVAKISLSYQGYASTDTWTPSTTTGVATAPTNGYLVFADAVRSDSFVSGSIAAAAPGSYSLFSYNGTGVPVPTASWTKTTNGGSSPVALEVATVWARRGVSAQAYDNYAELKIGRFENASVNARTKIMFALTHASGDATGTDVFGMYSNGRLQAPISNPPASPTAAGNAGDISWDSSYLYLCTATNTWKQVYLSTSGTGFLTLTSTQTGTVISTPNGSISSLAFLGEINSTGITYKQATAISVDSSPQSGSVFPYDATITDVIVKADVTSTVTFEIWLDGSKISASDPVVLTAGTSVTKSSFTGWTTNVSKGQELQYKLTQNDNATRLRAHVIYKHR